ncbi:uncharacterized protein B0I36DRAFT_369119 [Microdochium trichocladiopsis]|uniref:Uncharacterized protein n=1 Tax=Microdochium trichocladiopsis TaxID=1682393 RepID=A0A9P8XUN3_9PEZI|nr:uncharacterized protein B0I36DRAFT_369119 [Microdochium trichocladiopsis]KAH7014127.1 hypothetical protein B0I36DRAFT_369119 [Microdochium trichocladiopsis]
MPATDALSPPLTPAERQVVKNYGGWTQFMHSFGLKAHDSEHIDEAHQIARTFAAGGEAEVEAEPDNRSAQQSQQGGGQKK